MNTKFRKLETASLTSKPDMPRYFSNWTKSVLWTMIHLSPKEICSLRKHLLGKDNARTKDVCCDNGTVRPGCVSVGLNHLSTCRLKQQCGTGGPCSLQIDHRFHTDYLQRGSFHQAVRLRPTCPWSRVPSSTDETHLAMSLSHE